VIRLIITVVRWYQQASTKARRPPLRRRRHSLFIVKECMRVEIRKNTKKNNIRRKMCILIYYYIRDARLVARQKKKIRRTTLTSASGTDRLLNASCREGFFVPLVIIIRVFRGDTRPFSFRLDCNYIRGGGLGGMYIIFIIHILYLWRE